MYNECEWKASELKQQGVIKEMTEYYDKWEKEIAEEAAEEAIEQRNIEVAMKMIAEGSISLEVISNVTGLTIEKVTELARAKAV